MIKLHCFCASLALTGTLLAQDIAQWTQLVARSGLSLSEAIDRGLKRAGNGTAYHAELELDDRRLVYSIDIWQGDTGVNVVLDARTGELIEQVEESADMRAAVAACKLDLKRAIEVAGQTADGRAIEAQLFLRGDRPVVDVRALRKGELVTIVIDGVTGEAVLAPAAAGEVRFQDVFAVDEKDLVPHGENPFFILTPGWQLVLEGKEGRDQLRVAITILEETRVIDGVRCAVLEEREWENGELAEVSRNFFAISKRSNAVYYFGEEVDDYEEGRIIGHGGAWESGKDGARFGLFMPGTPLLGARYYNEIAPGVAMDRVEITSVAETIRTPAGTFEACVRWRETTPLEPGVGDAKAFARGVGFVLDGPLRLVEYGRKGVR